MYDVFKRGNKPPLSTDTRLFVKFMNFQTGCRTENLGTKLTKQNIKLWKYLFEIRKILQYTSARTQRSGLHIHKQRIKVNLDPF